MELQFDWHLAYSNFAKLILQGLRQVAELLTASSNTCLNVSPKIEVSIVVASNVTDARILADSPVGEDK